MGIDGMKQHLIALKKTYPDYTMKISKMNKNKDYFLSLNTEGRFCRNNTYK